MKSLWRHGRQEDQGGGDVGAFCFKKEKKDTPTDSLYLYLYLGHQVYRTTKCEVFKT
jgi:hypothetical protein